jgi:epoxyqueuosine reductase QueG
LRSAIERLAPGVETRVYVDTGPILERAFARLSGIGWTGKNTCLINQQKGSWFFIGVILTSLDLKPDTPAFDRCGSCRRCIDACPTGALVEPYVMDASRCIAYFNIELKGAIPAEFRPAIGANVFGCDICQDVCPWNGHSSLVLGPSSHIDGSEFVVRSSSLPAEDRNPKLENRNSTIETRDTGIELQDHRRRGSTTRLPEFHPLMIEKADAAQLAFTSNGQLTIDNGQPRTNDKGLRTSPDGQLTTDNGQERTNDKGLRTNDQGPFSLFHPRLSDLASLTEDDFRRIFRDSPIKRVKYRGWLRNLCVVMGNSGDRRLVPWLERMRLHEDALVREHAEWAIERLAERDRT